jgi:hypothetical protein
MKTGIELIAEERQRQIEVEGWTPEHDDRHTKGELAMAAAAYASRPNIIVSVGKHDGVFITIKRGCLWPFGGKDFKPSYYDDRIRELVKAGALIVAEIDRLQALEQKEQS